MTRPIREDYPGAWHHVMNRGRNRELIFRNDEDALDFLGAVGDTVERFGVEVHAYSLMPNHYHLLVRTPLGNLSSSMKHLGAVYTQLFNRRHNRDGSLFRGRFNSQLVKDEAYLMYLTAYIHLNPLKAGLITRLDGVRGWTSHRRYMGKESEPNWLTTEVITLRFGSPQKLKDMILKLHQKAVPWPEAINLEDGRFGQYLLPANPKKPEVLISPSAKPLDELIRIICEIASVGQSRLKESIRGSIGNPERRFAVWALQTSTYLTHREIGKALGMTVYHVAREVRRNRDGIAGFDEWSRKWLQRFPKKVSVIQA